MSVIVNPSSLHRGAKYFMDSGRAQSVDEAMALLRGFGLTICVGPSIAHSPLEQIALLTLVNTAHRAFLAGVDVVGLPDCKSLTRLASNRSLRKSVLAVGGRIKAIANPAFPAAVIGDSCVPASASRAWRLTWAGWRGGVTPVRDERRLAEREASTLAPMVAAAACSAEAFAYFANDHVMAGRRSLGLSLWRPGVGWLADDRTEPSILFLPSRLWIIGLGNLGQAFAWVLAGLPYADPRAVQLVLQDFDVISESNRSTSLLAFGGGVGLRKARVVSGWLEARGFETALNETRFGPWTGRSGDDPAVALCGVDNALARTALAQPKFGLVVEAGLGAGPSGFRSFALHTFPGSRTPEEIWSKQVGVTNENVETQPAYQRMKTQGADACGVAQLASRTVAVPFVGLTAACLVVSELLRRLHAGTSLELASGSLAALSDVESVSANPVTYSFGHVPSQ